MHVGMHVVDALDPFETDIGDILTHEGALMGYTYDLGDQFEHVITCTKILSAQDSTGACTVLGGSMRCPNEDGNGNRTYQKQVLDVLDRPGALAAACSQRARAINCENGRFDPYDFSVEACQNALTDALGSKASAGMGGGVEPRNSCTHWFQGDPPPYACLATEPRGRSKQWPRMLTKMIYLLPTCKRMSTHAQTSL